MRVRLHNDGPGLAQDVVAARLEPTGEGDTWAVFGRAPVTRAMHAAETLPPPELRRDEPRCSCSRRRHLVCRGSLDRYCRPTMGARGAARTVRLDDDASPTPTTEVAEMACCRGLVRRIHIDMVRAGRRTPRRRICRLARASALPSLGSAGLSPPLACAVICDPRVDLSLRRGLALRSDRDASASRSTQQSGYRTTAVRSGDRAAPTSPLTGPGALPRRGSSHLGVPLVRRHRGSEPGGD